MPRSAYVAGEIVESHCIHSGSTEPQVFRAAVTYLKPPTETTSLADITIGWPALGIPIDSGSGQPDFSKASGKVEAFAAINR